MQPTASVVWGDPDVARDFLLVAAGLAALAAVGIVWTAVADLADLPQPRHSALLTALAGLVAVGAVLAVANGYLGGGLLASLALAVAPALVAVAGMLLAPALDLSQPDVSLPGALLMDAYLLAVTLALGLAGFLVGRGVGWAVGRIAG